jgi:hypothetical protein
MGDWAPSLSHHDLTVILARLTVARDSESTWMIMMIIPVRVSGRPGRARGPGAALAAGCARASGSRPGPGTRRSESPV